jgi:hypothetical protein
MRTTRRDSWFVPEKPDRAGRAFVGWTIALLVAGAWGLPVASAAADWAGASDVGGATTGLAYVERSSGLEVPRMEGGRTELEFSDVDADGHVDMVSIGDHGSPFINADEHGVMVWFGDGTGNWSVFQYGNFGYGGCALGDVDGDGLMDIAYGMHHDYSGDDLGDQIFEVARGDGTGRSWTAWDDGLATNGETWGMFGTDLADIDLDGDLDVGAISFGCCAGIHVYRNNGDGTWTQSWGFLGGNSNQEFQFGDVNGDGFPDLAAAHGSGTVYVGDGAGGFTNADGNMGSVWRSGVALGDVTDDGRDDLAFTVSGGLQVWTMDGPNQWRNISGNLPTSGLFRIAQIADMDLDGHGDVIGYGYGSNAQVQVFAGDGTGNWTPIATIDSAASCGHSAFRAGVDVDHNGYPDLAFVSEEDCRPFTGGRNRPRLFVEASQPSETWVFPKYPRGGEVFHAGSVRFIDWHAAVAGGETSMTIELSQDGVGGPWTRIADAVPNNGRFQWRLPRDLRSSSDNYLRFTLGAAQATTPRAFSIISEGTVVQPVGFVVTHGVHTGGAVEDLYDSDDSYVVVEARLPDEVAAASAEIVASGFSPVETPESLVLTVEAGTSGAPVRQRIEMFNFAGGVWETLDERDGPTPDTTVELSVSRDASRFVDPDTGEMRARIGYHDRGVTFPAWGGRYDRVGWVVAGS